MLPQLENIDPISFYEREIRLSKAGGARHRGLCPFHADKNSPSFYIFPDNRFHCFGCGEHGDVIDFIRKLYGLDFKQALRFLGIAEGPVEPEVWADIKMREKKAELVKAFRLWEAEKADELATLVRATRKVMNSGILAPENLDDFAEVIKGLATLEYQFFDILCAGDDRAKYALRKECNGRKI